MLTCAASGIGCPTSAEVGKDCIAVGELMPILEMRLINQAPVLKSFAFPLI